MKATARESDLSPGVSHGQRKRTVVEGKSRVFELLGRAGVGMSGPVLCGNVFIKSGTPLPEHFQFTFEDWGGWKRLMDLDSNTLEHVAIRTGWHFSFITTAIEASGFDLRLPLAMRSALKKIMGTLEQSSFNSFEITQAGSHRVLLLYHADVVANPRHLWPNPFLQEPDPHHYPNGPRDFRTVFWKAAEAGHTVEGI